ncbi:unnamed protein product [marine sediment metagenome]|uniref:Uncharacterized protein n=1 Tax=marine sediment metagenome TaxID=412755 RepID=X0TYW5_9ZZZZ
MTMDSVRVDRWCGCMRTDCCLRTGGWSSYDWVPKEWAEQEKQIEMAKEQAHHRGESPKCELTLDALKILVKRIDENEKSIEDIREVIDRTLDVIGKIVGVKP